MRYLFLLSLFFYSTVNAAPAPTSVASAAAHGDSITISGSDFGTKSPAAPLVWDDGSDNTKIDTYYDHYLPTAAQQGSTYNMQYRAVGYRSVDGPHDRTSYYLTGAHAINRNTDTYTTGGTVGIGKNIDSFQHFISYYYRLDPLYDEEDHDTLTDNLKELVLSNDQANFYPGGGGAFGYYGWCDGDSPDSSYTDQVAFLTVDITDPYCGYYKCTENGNEIDHNNPVNGWIKMQWEGDFDSVNDKPTTIFTTYPDGNITDTSYYGNDITTYEYYSGEVCGGPTANDLAFIGIGGFGRVPRVADGVNSFRYFTDVYIDDTRARVMLGDESVYASCTVLEPQIPTAWSATSVTVTVNRGALGAGAAYLFVFNSDNEISGSHAITISD